MIALAAQSVPVQGANMMCNWWVAQFGKGLRVFVHALVGTHAMLTTVHIRRTGLYAADVLNVLSF